MDQKKKDIVPFEHVNFNAVWANGKTEKEFIEHERHHGLTDAQLSEAYKLCKLAQNPPAEVVETKQTPAPAAAAAVK